MIDSLLIRQEFPILSTKVYGRDLVYLDNAATTQRPLCVVNRIRENYLKTNANIHRGVHFLSEKATVAHENSRSRICDFIHASSPSEIIFTRGTTEAINLVAFSFGERFLTQDSEVWVSEMEHHSNIVPWQMTCNRHGATLRVIPFTDDGLLDIDYLRTHITSRTKIISVTHVSNVLGTINDIQNLSQIAHSVGASILVDAAQSFPHLPIDVQKLDVDFLVCSAHKIYGPTGMGFLYGKISLLEQMPPYQGGGEMIDKVSFEETTYAAPPFKFEAGTPDFIGSTAFAEAINFVSEIGISNIAQHEQSLLLYARERLSSVEGIRFYGNAPHKAGVLSFNIEGIHPYDIGSILDKLGIAVRTGHHCAQPIMRHYGVDGMVRVSFAVYNTIEEIDVLYQGLLRTIKMFHV